MLDLPDLVRRQIADLLTAKSLARLSMTCKTLRETCLDESLWKRHCLDDFSWFFWTGSCERSLASLVNAPRLFKQCDGPLGPYSLNALNDHRYGAVCDGDFGVSCPSSSCKVVARQSFNPLPRLYREAYVAIASGEWIGMLQVLNSMSDRQCSAFTALVQYNFKTLAFDICYNRDLIILYQNNKKISITQNIDETVRTSDRHHFRRIPFNILNLDPRCQDFSLLYTTPLANDGRLLLKPGQEIEVQWRQDYTCAWSWWRGHVTRMHVKRAYPEYSSQGPPPLMGNEAIHGDQDLIEVVHYNYPPASGWRKTFISLDGAVVRLGSNLGEIGGIRNVECIVHQLLWKMNFKFVYWRGDQMSLDQMGYGDIPVEFIQRLIDPWTFDSDDENGENSHDESIQSDQISYESVQGW
jgi:hypothetical protein